MQNLYYTFVSGSLYHTLIAVDKPGTLYYASLAKTKNKNALKELMAKDFSKVKDYKLNALVSSTSITKEDLSKMNKTVDIVRESMEDPKSMDIKKLKYKIIFGTSLQRKVWERLLEIENGKVTDYNTLAAELNMPTSSRVIGNCVGANKLAPFIPCHRVLTKERKISGYRYGIDIKKDILQGELGNDFSKYVK